MPCVVINQAIVCGFHPFYRLPLANGMRIYMEVHRYCGPTFYYDKAATREVDEWWDNPLINDAWEWFHGRGERA